MPIYEWEFLVLSHYADKSYGNKHCDSGDIMLLICQVTTCLKSYVDLLVEASTVWSIKSFDRISHELLIAKLNSYGFDIKSLNFILAYFTNRKQKTKIGSSFSDFPNIIFVVPQGSILGPFFSSFTYVIYLWNMT